MQLWSIKRLIRLGSGHKNWTDLPQNTSTLPGSFIRSLALPHLRRSALNPVSPTISSPTFITASQYFPHPRPGLQKFKMLAPGWKCRKCFDQQSKKDPVKDSRTLSLSWFSSSHRCHFANSIRRCPKCEHPLDYTCIEGAVRFLLGSGRWWSFPNNWEVMRWANNYQGHEWCDSNDLHILVFPFLHFCLHRQVPSKSHTKFNFYKQSQERHHRWEH